MQKYEKIYDEEYYWDKSLEICLKNYTFAPVRPLWGRLLYTCLLSAGFTPFGRSTSGYT